jgi:hypothetical protein
MNKKPLFILLPVLLLILILGIFYTISKPTNSNNANNSVAETTKSSSLSESLISSVSKISISSSSNSLSSFSQTETQSEVVKSSNESLQSQTLNIDLKNDDGNDDGELIVPSTDKDIKPLNYTEPKG